MGETVTASAIARVLHESCHIVIARALKVLGQERCVDLLVDALTIESNGGMWLKDGSRRRSLGGTFLNCAGSTVHRRRSARYSASVCVKRDTIHNTRFVNKCVCVPGRSRTRATAT